MNRAQLDGLLDLFLLCKAAKEAWLALPIDQKGGDFGELSQVVTMSDELYESGVPEAKIFQVLSTTLPPAVFYRTFPSYTGFPSAA